MSTSEVVCYLATWGIIGSALFSLFVIFVFRTGVVYNARDEDGLLKEKIPIQGYLASIGFLVLIVFFLVTANYFGLIQKGFRLSFGGLYALNLVLYLILFLFDTIVIDGLVLGYWQPGFLKLPQAMGWDSMRKHMRKSIPAGAFFGLIITLVSTVLTYYFII